MQLTTEISEIETELSKCADNFAEIGNIIESIVEIVGNVGFLLKSSKVGQKRAFLKLILSNLTIDDKKVWISLKKTVRFT